MAHWLAVEDATGVVEPGRTPLLLLLMGLLGSFLFIRFSVRMIRRGVSWWPGNVQPGGTHIHHVVFGQAMMLIGGIGAFSVGGGPVAFDAFAALFGVGCGLVLDEFALVLHLEDVYWKEEGRQSVDAVILAVAVVALLLTGQAPLGGYVGGRSYAPYLIAAALLLFVLVCLFKGKVWTGLLGVMLPVLALVGALRLARPGSPWARWRYTARPRRMARSERREERVRDRVMTAKTRMMDAVAGAPTAAPRPAVSPSAPTPASFAPPSLAPPPPSRPPSSLAPPSPAAPPRQPQPSPRPQHGTPPEPEPTPPEPRTTAPLAPPRLRAPAAALAVWYLRAAALLNAVTAVVAPLRERVRAAAEGEYVAAFLVSPGFTGAAVAFVLSVGLRRRKRAAWWVTAVPAAVYAVVAAVALASVPQARGHPANWVALGLTLLLLAALLASRRAFDVRGEQGNGPTALLSLLVGGAIGVGAGTLIVHATDRTAPNAWGASARYAAVRVLTVTGLFGLPGVDVPAWTDLVVNLLSLALVAGVLTVLLRAPRMRRRLPPADERRLRAVLRACGGDALGYFALRRELSVCWDPGRRAAVAYRVVNGVALAFGDPLGVPGDQPAAVAQWLEAARRHAWVPAVAAAGRDGVAVYRAAGLSAARGGEEGVLPVGPLPAELAEARRSAAASGYTALVRRQGEVDRREWPLLGQLADAWRPRGGAWRDAHRRALSLGRLGDPADGACVVAQCVDRRGRTCALLVLVPWGRDALTVDLMRHDPESGRVTVDFLLAEVVGRAAAGQDPVAGVTKVSLNVGPVPGYASARPRGLLYARRSELPRVLAANAYAHPVPALRRGR